MYLFQLKPGEKFRFLHYHTEAENTVLAQKGNFTYVLKPSGLKDYYNSKERVLIVNAPRNETDEFGILKVKEKEKELRKKYRKYITEIKNNIYKIGLRPTELQYELLKKQSNIKTKEFTREETILAFEKAIEKYKLEYSTEPPLVQNPCYLLAGLQPENVN